MKDNLWYQISIKDSFKKLNSNIIKGLANREVLKRQAINVNVLEEDKKSNPTHLFFNQFTDTMVLVLLVATVISGIIGDIADAITIMVIVIINAILGFVQEFRAERSLEAIKKLATPHALVLRDGKRQKILARELVPGDIVYLIAGDKIPADLRLIETYNLEIDEATLTGESLPVEKDALAVYDKEIPIAEQKNLAFMGTAITKGRGVGLVVATGMNTVMGQIALMIKETKPSLTPLQTRLDQLGKILIVICIIVCILVALMGIYRGETILIMLMAAISLAVAAIPEGLPAIVTIVLALGVQRLAKSNAIIRKLPAVETLGCTNVICADKTGTLTKNEMTVTKIASYDLVADVISQKNNKKLAFIHHNKPINVIKDLGLNLTLQNAFYCNNAFLDGNDEKGGEPTELALLTMVKDLAINKDFKRVREISFTSDRKKMSVVVSDDKSYYIFVKGALDILINSCTDIIKKQQAQSLSSFDKKALFNLNESWANEALRVLGFAYKKLTEDEVLNLSDELLESNLTLTGICGMIDPPREGVEMAVSECVGAGIIPIMITGDHPTTARAIAKSIGITKQDKVITATDIDGMNNEELYIAAISKRVFARVSPEHKHRIVNVLKNKNYVVAMTGDGVNDAPAIKAADIGIAMGITGTEVSKEAAAMVLADDDFSTIIKAVYEGRAIYDNIRKFIRYLLGCNIGEVLVMFLASLFAMPLPLLPIQILWVNLITDGLPAMALGLEPPEPNIMQNKPRPKNEGIFARRLGLIIMGRGIYIGVITLLVFTIGLIYCQYMGIDDLSLPRTMALTSLVFCQLFYVFECRSEKYSPFELGFFSNKFLLLAVLISVIMQLVVIYIPFFQNVFKTVPLETWQWLVIILFTGGKFIFKNFILILRRFFF
ncbi:MAG: cation-translocating P-type ATPase [Syntrophomonadaceae bacterium]|nr:cation-translocating P-type ATPase [Syntrophomonadaceae bacterium]